MQTSQPLSLHLFKLLFSLSSLLLAIPSAFAQQRFCVVDDYTWEVACGRVASYDEINQYNYSRQGIRQPHANERPRTDVWHQNHQQPVIQVQPQIPNPSQSQYFERKENRGDDRKYPNAADYGPSDQELGSMINRLYQEVLGRNADKSGLNTHIAQLKNGKSIGDIRSSLASSNEAKQAINRQYQEVLGRNGDPNGIAFYHQKLISGESLKDIRNSLANSDEARKRR